MSGESSNSTDAFQPATRHASIDWQRPAGVSQGTWDYMRGSGIPSGYDESLRNDPLTVIDRNIINHYLPAVDQLFPDGREDRPVVADLGCGTGRHAWQLAEAGYRVLAVDLSLGMLNELVKKKSVVGIPHATSLFERIHPIQANLVQLNGFATGSLDHAVCMFSTLGMIQGRLNRMRFLNEVRRLVKPDGQLILHVHNVWYQSRHVGGKSWLIKSACRAIFGKGEFGDRYADYRSVKNMFIHSFRRKELRRDLFEAGFKDLQWHGIAPFVCEAQKVSLWKTLQLVGWIVRAT